MDYNQAMMVYRALPWAVAGLLLVASAEVIRHYFLVRSRPLLFLAIGLTVLALVPTNRILGVTLLQRLLPPDAPMRDASLVGTLWILFDQMLFLGGAILIAVGSLHVEERIGRRTVIGRVWAMLRKIPW